VYCPSFNYGIVRLLVQLICSKNRVAIDCIVVCMCVTNPQKQGHFKGAIGSQLENGAQEASHACMATARKWSGPGSQGGLHWATYRYSILYVLTYRYRHLVCLASMQLACPF
jgi:hypothetical protein